MKKKLRILMCMLLVFTLALPVVPIKAAATYALNTKTVTITGVGKTYQLKLTAPKKSTATYKSTNKSIATVSKKGLITAKKKGSTSITCTVKTGKLTKYLVCKVTVKVPAKAIVITNAKIDEDMGAHIIELGTTYDFAAKRISSSSKSASSDVIRFYIGDTSIATVDNKKGIVTPLKKGRTTLTVCAGATAKKATAPKNPIKQVIDIYVRKPEITVQSATLTNSQQIDFTFSHSMNAATIYGTNGELLSAVKISERKGAVDPGTLTGSLSEDGKVLTITCSKYFSGVYDISLSKAILSKDGTALTPYTESLELMDIVNPTYLGCSVDETGLVVSMNFSEPISIKDLSPMNPRKLNGSYLVNPSMFLDKKNYKLSQDKRSILLDLSGISLSDQNTTIELTLYGIVDYANNTTNPYPLTVQIYTNTTSTSQANLVTLFRNGNSLIAQFDKAIQTAGYAIIENDYITGTVNPENKKEVIYNLSNHYFSSKTSVTVKLSGFSTYNATTGSSEITKTITFASTPNPPVITKNEFTTEKVGGITRNTLTLTFNRSVSLLQKVGSLNGISNVDGIISSSAPFAYTAEVKDNVVSIVFADSFAENGIYTFAIPEKFVMDNYYNYNSAIQVTATKQAGETQALPGPSSIQISGTYNEKVYITFDQMIDAQTAQDKNNYKISGVTIESANVVSNTYGCPSVIELTTKASSIVDSVPYQVSISGLKGHKGSFSVMEPYQTMIYLSNNKTLDYLSINASATSKSIVMTFPSNLSSASRVHYTATVNSKNIEIKSTNITGSTITLILNDSITRGSTITLKPATDNLIMDMSNKKLLNTTLSCVISQ